MKPKEGYVGYTQLKEPTQIKLKSKKMEMECKRLYNVLTFNTFVAQ